MPVDEICRAAAAMDAPAAGLADVNGLFGLPRFLAECRRYGLKPVCGTAVFRGDCHLMTLYALSGEGFARINRLLTRQALTEEGEGGACFDPVSFLLEEGTGGLAVILFDPDAAFRLSVLSAGSGAAGLYLGLRWGIPFAALCRRASELGLPTMAVNDAVFAEGEDPFAYRVLRAVGSGRLVDDLPAEERLHPHNRLAAPQEMLSFFHSRPEALEAAERLVREAEEFVFPVPPIFPPFGGLDPAAAFGRLSSLCREGLLRRYGTLRPELTGRLQYELSIIRDKGFASYFLVVHDVVSRFPRTCGRGSAAASIVSYALGITHVDPIACDLYFERFLNRGRMDPPDIDVDFPWDEREKALDYLFSSYPERSALVADHVRYGPRASIRETTRVMALDREEADRMCAMWQNGEQEQLPRPVASAAGRLLGIPRYLGTHPGGLVISPGALTDHVHYRRSPLGRPVIAWEKDGAEDMGLIKIDFLGNRSLGVLRDAIALVNPLLLRRGKEPLTWETFSPIGDPEVEEMIRKGDTLGVFYVESPATRQLLQKMDVGDYTHLVAASSIIRPAANRQAEEYVRRLHGGAWDPFPGETGKVLEENLGILIYQEDVSRVAMAAAGFSPAEADRLRKILSKKDVQVQIEEFRERFFSGGEKGPLSRQQLETLWEGFLSFDGYSFCKAHSASYALVSYRLAWLKLRFPLQFFTAVLNNGGGFYAPQVYLNALRRIGITIIPPDVNRSGIGYRAIDSEEKGENGDPRGAVLLGLDRIRGVGEPVIGRILEYRARCGPFSGFQSFLREIRPDTASLRGLIRSGALDSLSGTSSRPMLFWAAARRSRPAAWGEELFPEEPPAVVVNDYPESVKLRDEHHFLGLFASVHPLVPYLGRVPKILRQCRKERSDGDSIVTADSSALADLEGHTVAAAGYLVAEKELMTVKKSGMAFVSFEDPAGLFEGVLFPAAYERCHHLFTGGLAFLVVGRVEKSHKSIQIVIDQLLPLFRQGPG
jgi:error-prone DNA polymerase